jgi:lipopolysaccharide transport system permease protein
MERKNSTVKGGLARASGETTGGAGGWTTVIRPRNPWFHLNLAEIWRYRDLILLFVHRDFVARYKQTILGPLWFFLQPLLTASVLTVVFGRIARIPTDGVPPFLFYFSGTVCWTYFSMVLTETCYSFTGNAAIFGKVYFPRLVIPLSIAISNILKFFIQLIVFLGFLIYYWFQGTPIAPSAWVLALPLLVLEMGLLGVACGIIVSSLTTKYRDLALLVTFGVQLWMFATPVVYPLSQVPLRYRGYFAANPMTPVVESFRAAFLGTKSVPPEYVIMGWLIILGLLFVGLVLFSRAEKSFMDTI